MKNEIHQTIQAYKKSVYRTCCMVHIKSKSKIMASSQSSSTPTGSDSSSLHILQVPGLCRTTIVSTSVQIGSAQWAQLQGLIYLVLYIFAKLSKDLLEPRVTVSPRLFDVHWINLRWLELNPSQVEVRSCVLLMCPHVSNRGHVTPRARKTIRLHTSLTNTTPTNTLA